MIVAFLIALIVVNEFDGYNSNGANLYSVAISVESDSNWFFNKHDYEILIDDEQVLFVAHGKTNSNRIKVAEGEHILSIKTDSLTTNNQKQFLLNVSENMSFSFLIDSNVFGFTVTDKNDGTEYKSSDNISIYGADTAFYLSKLDNIINIDRNTLYAYSKYFEEQYVRTVVRLTEVNSSSYRSELIDEDCDYLFCLNNDFKTTDYSASVGDLVIIVGKVSNTATSPVILDDCFIETGDIEVLLLELETLKESNMTNIQAQLNSVLDAVFQNDVLVAEFEFVCAQIGIDAHCVSNIEEIEGWAGGKQYTFTYAPSEDPYSRYTLTLVCNANSSIQSLLASDTKLYERGYESYQLSDYSMDADVAYSLYIFSQSYMEEFLKYPDSAKFDSNVAYDYAFGVYTISGSVSALNAFGVRNDMPYTVKFEIDDTTGNAAFVYFKLDGTIYMDTVEEIPERTTTDVQTPVDTMTLVTTDATGNSINLIYGQLGMYGTSVTYDGYTFIEYHIESGTYEIVNQSNLCTVYVCSNEYYKTSEGYMENDIIETVKLTEKDQIATIIIGQNEHLELTIGADIALNLLD